MVNAKNLTPKTAKEKKMAWAWATAAFFVATVIPREYNPAAYLVNTVQNRLNQG